jgi:hypothetical protein
MIVMTRDRMSDQDLNQLLARASTPVVPRGAEDRLMDRLIVQQKPQAAVGNVVAFTPRSKPGAPGASEPRSAIAWLAGLPLAASLAFGLWLGAAGVGTGLLPESLGGALAAAEDSMFSGVDDAELLSEESQS